MPGVKPRSLPEQAKLFRELGFEAAYELWLDDALPANFKVFDDAGLRVFMLWTSVNVNPSKPPAYDARALEAIRQLKGREATVCTVLSGLPPADPQGMAPAVKALASWAMPPRRPACASRSTITWTSGRRACRSFWKW